MNRISKATLAISLWSLSFAAFAGGNLTVAGTIESVGDITSEGSISADGAIKGRALFSSSSGANRAMFGNPVQNSTIVDELKTEIELEAGDIVRVDLTCNVTVKTGTVYMVVVPYQTPNLDTVLPGQWITYKNDQDTIKWAPGLSFGVFKATAAGSATFTGQWHTSGNGKAEGAYVYCNIMAQVIGRG